MKIGARAHDFGRMTESELPKAIKQAGFDAVQLAFTKAIVGIEKFEDIKDEHIEKIGEEFAKNNLEISVLGCYIEPSIPDNEQRLKNIDNFKRGLEQAKALGIKIVGTETTNFAIDGSDSKREDTYQILKDSVLRMVEKAEKENVIVGIEPVAEHTLNTPLLTRRLLDEVGSNRLKVIFDPVNLILPNTAGDQEKIYSDLFELVGDDIVAVHLKDVVMHNGEKQWRNINDGIVNYNFIFEWLNKNKPDISLLREHVKMDSYNYDLEAIKSFIITK